MMSPSQLRNFIETSEAKIKEMAAAAKKEEEAKEARLAIKALKEEWNKSTTFSNYANVCVKMRETWGDKECKDTLTVDCWNANSFEELEVSVTACFNSLNGTSSISGCQHDNISLLKAVCDQNYAEVKKITWDSSADVNDKNKNGENALHLAIKTGNIAILKQLISVHVPNEVKDNNGMTPVMVAVQKGDYNIFSSYVKEANPNINKKNNAGQTLLHVAIENGNNRIATYLIENGDVLEDEDNDGNRPLHLAAQNNNYEIVGKLIDKGADVDNENYDGKKPIDLTTDNRVKMKIKDFMTY